MSSPQKFQGGQISEHINQWAKLSSDRWILDNVLGVEIPFVAIPEQVKRPRPIKLSQTESDFVDEEIEVMVEKGIVEKVEPLEGQVISNIFLRPKKDGRFRFILDLTWVNLHVEYEHFKMFSLHTALEMMRPDCWMGSIDLKDAYYSVPIREEDRKFLRFFWREELFQFRVLPNGLACAPRVFTKLLTPVFASLRETGCEAFPYIDDSFVVGDSVERCRESLRELRGSLEKLGFVIHEDKSGFEPTKQLVFLGFILDSEEFKIFLTKEKEEKLIRAAEGILEKGAPSIREVAGLVGLMVAFAQGFPYGGAHYKRIEADKIGALRDSRGDFDQRMVLSQQAGWDIQWWMRNIQKSGKLITESRPDCVIYTDASNEGWGAHVGASSAGGRWTEIESEDHINVLELRAILFGLKSLCGKEREHVRIMTDNTTALAYVKNQGGVRSVECNQVALEIWDWAEDREIWLSIAHIPGVENVLADRRSRVFADNLEWELNESLFAKIVKIFGQPEIDLFATRLNKKVPVYVSWGPEPEAFAVDAFSIVWTDHFFYAFPPFSCVGQAIQKAMEEGATGVMIVPWWPTKPWWGRLVALKLRRLKFRKKKGNLLPRGNPDNVQLMSRVPLGAFRFSGRNC